MEYCCAHACAHVAFVWAPHIDAAMAACSGLLDSPNGTRANRNPHLPPLQRRELCPLRLQRCHGLSLFNLGHLGMQRLQL